MNKFTAEDARKQTEKAINDYTTEVLITIHNEIAHKAALGKDSLYYDFASYDSISPVIKKLKEEGYEVEAHSSLWEQFLVIRW